MTTAPFNIDDTDEWVVSPCLSDKERPGVLLRAARYRKHFTQKKLAELIGISVKKLQKMEQNKVKISISEAMAFAAILETDFDNFV